MKKLIVTYIFCLLFISFAFAQHDTAMYFLKQYKEVHFKFPKPTTEVMRKLIRMISIDHIRDNDSIYAIANAEEFSAFLKIGIPYDVINPHPIEIQHNTLKGGVLYSTYPSYEEYVAMMNKFVQDYPDLCKLYSIGTTPNNHEILALKISDYASEKEAEPEFCFNSTMHGDETAGYVLMLHLIDSLLTGYMNGEPRIQNMVDNVEIWILPNINPDGSYVYGNTAYHLLNYSTRGNANGADINRRFPDPWDGLYPGGSWQTENTIMMNFYKSHNFQLSANLHGGAEVINYPWDGYTLASPDYRGHPMNSWFQYICKEYADTAKYWASKKYSSTYLTSITSSGITNGGDWYYLFGGIQDYRNFYCHGRDVTMELSNSKTLSESYLIRYWNYNKQSFLNYIEQTLFGVRGIITDSATNQPIKAKVWVVGTDADSSEVYNTLPHGNYHRMLITGKYNLKFTAPGYKDKIIYDVSVTNKYTTILNVQLSNGIASDSPKKIDQSFDFTLSPNPTNQYTKVFVSDYVKQLQKPIYLNITNCMGKTVYSNVYDSNHFFIDVADYQSGMYILNIESNGKLFRRKLLVVR